MSQGKALRGARLLCGAPKDFTSNVNAAAASFSEATAGQNRLAGAP